MPYVLRPRGLHAAVTALLGAAAILVVPAAASAACPSTPTTKAFAAFGDGADYSLVPGGSFNAGAPGWGLANASVAGKSLAIAPSYGVVLMPGEAQTIEQALQLADDRMYAHKHARSGARGARQAA